MRSRPVRVGEDDVFKRFEWEIKGRKERGAHATMDTGEKEEHPTCTARKEEEEETTAASFKTPFEMLCSVFFSGRVRKNERTTGEHLLKTLFSLTLSPLLRIERAGGRDVHG